MNGKRFFIGEDFFQFLVGTLYLLFPFVSIYFVLFTLNWNKRQNLLSDSWFVFIALLASSFVASFVVALIEHNRLIEIESFAVSIISIFLANVFAVTAVLYFKLRAKAEDLSVTGNLADDKTGNVGIIKIWQTSVIVSFMTLVMVASLFFALQDISQKLEGNKKGKNGVSFGVYD